MNRKKNKEEVVKLQELTTKLSKTINEYKVITDHIDRCPKNTKDIILTKSKLFGRKEFFDELKRARDKVKAGDMTFPRSIRQ